MYSAGTRDISLSLQTKRKLPASGTFPAPPSGTCKIISGRLPIVANDPAKDPLQGIHAFRSPLPRLAQWGSDDHGINS